MANFAKAQIASTFTTLIHEALTTPGTVSKVFSSFYQYSALNLFLAIGQALTRDIEPGPLNTFPKWKALNRSVSKGEKAIVLAQPLTFKTDNPDNPDRPLVKTWFQYKPRWFFLSQTQGDDYAPDPMKATWNKDQALTRLKIALVPFDNLNGNVGGYALHNTRNLAINPTLSTTDSYRVLFHECAHILLGHTDHSSPESGHHPPKTLKEAEAELVSYLVSSALNLDSASESRGYIQHWYKESSIPASSSTRVCTAASHILTAGKPGRISQ